MMQHLEFRTADASASLSSVFLTADNTPDLRMSHMVCFQLA
jgi:hypothetical protein